MTIQRVFAILAALVLVPFLLSWGTLLLIPAALLLVPCMLLAVIAALPALVVAWTQEPTQDVGHPHAPVGGTPAYSH